MKETKHQDFDKTCSRISELITGEYSTSFFSATRLLEKETREAIFNIYGFVRFTDEIVEQTDRDFDDAIRGLRKLPGRSRLAVYTAYLFYRALLHKIKRTHAHKVAGTRIRIQNWRKGMLMFRALLAYKLNLI